MRKVRRVGRRVVSMILKEYQASIIAASKSRKFIIKSLVQTDSNDAKHTEMFHRRNRGRHFFFIFLVAPVLRVDVGDGGVILHGPDEVILALWERRRGVEKRWEEVG